MQETLWIRCMAASYLPRKFKTAFAFPPLNDVDIFANDLGFVVIEEKGETAGLQPARRRRPGDVAWQRRRPSRAWRM